MFELSSKVACCRFNSRNKSKTLYKSYVKLAPSKSQQQSIVGCFCDFERSVIFCDHLILERSVIFRDHKVRRSQSSMNRELSFYSQTQSVISQLQRTQRNHMNQLPKLNGLHFLHLATHAVKVYLFSIVFDSEFQ